MQVKTTRQRQYARIVDEVIQPLSPIQVPAEGWLATLRKALGMSGPQLASRVGLTKAAIYQAERNEVDGAITLKQLEKLAAAMNGRLVYAIVPDDKVNVLIDSQAEYKAQAIMREAATHMGLEKQSVSQTHEQQEVTRLARELASTMPTDFWDAG